MERKKSPEVLIVEDEFATRMAAADAISDMGLQVHEASDAKEALGEMHEHPNIGVLFTDVQMPGQMSGLQLAEQVHQDRPDVELIVTSGGLTLEDSELPDNWTFLSKPYQASRLIEIVDRKVEDHSGESKRPAREGRSPQHQFEVRKRAPRVEGLRTLIAQPIASF